MFEGALQRLSSSGASGLLTVQAAVAPRELSAAAPDVARRHLVEATCTRSVLEDTRCFNTQLNTHSSIVYTNNILFRKPPLPGPPLSLPEYCCSAQIIIGGRVTAALASLLSVSVPDVPVCWLTCSVDNRQIMSTTQGQPQNSAKTKYVVRSWVVWIWLRPSCAAS